MMAGGLFAVPLSGCGQRPKEAKIGLLTERTLSPPHLDALRRGLAELGWVEGRSFRIEQRCAEGDLQRLPGLAAELVDSGAAVIVTGVESAATLAAKHATTTIPIVFVTGGDPVDFGIVANPRKPGENVTGFGGGIVAIQQLGMLRTLAPRTERVAFLRNLTNPVHAQVFRGLERAATIGRRRHLTLGEISVRDSTELDGAFKATQRQGFDALVVPGDAMFSRERETLVRLAERVRLPATYGDRLFPDGGGLMSFSVDLVELCERAARHVDQILRGARAGDLPMGEAVKYEAVLNVAAANSLGLTVPDSLHHRVELVHWQQ